MDWMDFSHHSRLYRNPSKEDFKTPSLRFGNEARFTHNKASF